MTRTGASVLRLCCRRARLDPEREPGWMGSQYGLFAQRVGVVKHEEQLRPRVLKLRSVGEPIPFPLRKRRRPNAPPLSAQLRIVGGR